MPTDKRARQKELRRQKLEAQRKAQRRQSVTRRAVVVVLVVAVVVLSAAFLFNSGNSKTTPTAHALDQTQVNTVAQSAGCPSSPSTRVNNLSWSSAPAMSIDTSQTYYAHVLTTQGPFVIKLNAKAAPVTVNNFVFLAKQKFYNCVTFHRVIPGFMNQTGDPTGTGSGGPGYTIPDELPAKGNPTYPLYSVAMANTGQPHTGGSQFFIVTGSAGETLPPSYSLFGQVVSGTRAVNWINQQGNSSQSANGVPPLVINRMLTVTITNQP